MKYLKKFNDHSEYIPFTQSEEFIFIRPNVSYCMEEDEAHYNHCTFVDEYLTTVALESGTISFNLWYSMGTDMITSISYSTDNGETWTTTNNTDNKEENLVITVNVSKGDKVMWKGDAIQLGYLDEDDYGDGVGSFFTSTCEFDAQGNIMSLLYGDDFKNKATIEKDYAFAYLFNSDYDEEKVCEVVNAKNLSLPATTLANSCYYSMFEGCTSLTTAPELSATTLAEGCYEGMFYGCTNLTIAPELLATTLAFGCYSYMFWGCTSLTTAPELPATTLARNCYYCMFRDCTSMTTAPELPATTLASSCYNNMFYGCTNLTTAPALPATTLAESCYESMFEGTNVLPDTSNIDFTSEQVVASGGLKGLFTGTNVTDNDLMRMLPKNNNGKYCLPATTLAYDCYDQMFSNCTSLTTAPALPATTLAKSCYGFMFAHCTSLTTAPELPATTLAFDCYSDMFNGCTSLMTAPELPATTLVKYCYSQMFKGCTSLNYIKCLATDISATGCTNNWVSNVASSGTFVKAESMTSWTTGVNGIPNNWTEQTASE